MATLLSQPGPGILDLDLALAQIGDVDAMNDMLVMLQDSLARDVPAVSTLLHAGDITAANRLLHALKGFVPIFCQAPFCEEVTRVELFSKDPASTEVTSAYSGLRPQLETLLAEVSAYLSANGISA
jgi:hypothetical protein